MNWKSKIFSLSLLACLISCEDGLETGYTGKGDGSLRIIASSPSGYTQTRATDELDVFIDSTKFYLYATKTTANGEDWDVNYLLKNPNPDPTKQDALAVGVADAEEKLGNAVRITAYTNSDNPEYEKLYSIASKFNEKPLNLYGIVAASNGREEREALETELSRSQYTFYRSDGKSAAVLMSHYAEDESGNEIATRKPLPDIMWSGSLKNLTPFENSGDIIMPFSHVLSKLRFHAIYIDNDIKEENKIVMTGFRLLDYKKGLLKFSDGLFDYNYDGSNTYLHRNEWIDITLPKDGVIPRDKQSLEQEGGGAGSDNQLDQFRLPDPFAIARIFPTYNTSYDNKFDADLTDDEPGVPVGSLQDGDISDEHTVKIEITYTIGGKARTLTVPLKNVGKNFAFAPNHEYDIVLTFTTESVVVAIEPMYYNYVDKSLPLDEYELGEPIDFGGVLWAAENLGATSANPTANAEAWERARGFYYQYGRNIPYYARGSVLDPHPTAPATNSWDKDVPHTLYKSLPADKKKNVYIPSSTDERGFYGTQDGHGARAYPYIHALWEKEIEDAGDTIKGYINFLSKYRFYSSQVNNGQSSPGKNFSDPYIADYIVSDPVTYPPSSVAYSAYYNIGDYRYARYWDQDKTKPQNWDMSTSQNNESDPCPKGWRLPNRAEFLSIFPYDHRCGDITFTPGWMDNKGLNGDARAFGGYGENPFDHTSGILVEPVPKDEDDPSRDYKGLSSIYVGIYKDGEGYNDLVAEQRSTTGTGNNQKFEVTQPKEGWGTIYCIKCAGTEEAYALRWQLKIVGYDPITKTVTDANINPPHQNTNTDHLFKGRGVIVISKYELGQNRQHAYLHYRELNDTEKSTYAHLPDDKRPDYKCIVFSNEGKKDITWNVYNAGVSREIDIDWNHPDGVMYLPIPGYIIMTSAGLQALLYSGREAIYWAADNGTDDTKGHFGTSVRIKFSGDYSSRFLYNTLDEYIANGGNIRCVRDTRAGLN